MSVGHVEKSMEVNAELLAQLLSSDTFLSTGAEVDRRDRFDGAVHRGTALSTPGGDRGKQRPPSGSVHLPAAPTDLADSGVAARSRKLVTSTGSAPLNDYNYILTEAGHEQARGHLRQSAYLGPCWFPFLNTWFRSRPSRSRMKPRLVRRSWRPAETSRSNRSCSICWDRHSIPVRGCSWLPRWGMASRRWPAA